VSKVSVIVPCYNASKFLPATLQSILSQTFRNFEVIAVDDCSTDSTLNVLRSYSDIKIIRHEKNKGQAAALNTAIKQANGEYIAFCDADDLWEPNKLERCVQFLERHRKYGLVYTNGYTIDENGERRWDLLPPGHEPPDQNGILLNCVINCPAQVVIRCEHALTFSEGMQSNDHDMWVRVAEITKLGYLPEHLSHYRKHSGQISEKRRQWEDGFVILRNAMRRRKVPLPVVLKRLAVLHYRLGFYDLKNGSRLRGLKHCLFSAMLDPVRAFRVAFGAD